MNGRLKGLGMARIDNLSLTRSLQADGWWYRVIDDTWSRMWDDEMQYGKIRDGKFERVFPEVPKVLKKALKETLLDRGWQFDLERDEFYRIELGHRVTGRIVNGMFVDGRVSEEPVVSDESTVRVEDGQMCAKTVVVDGNGFYYNPPLDAAATMADVGEEILRRESHPEVDAMCAESMKYAEPYEELWPEYGLRDMFAMHALPLVFFSSDPKGTALRAYEYADAMMVAREMKK